MAMAELHKWLLAYGVSLNLSNYIQKYSFLCESPDWKSFGNDEIEH